MVLYLSIGSTMDTMIVETVQMSSGMTITRLMTIQTTVRSHTTMTPKNVKVKKSIGLIATMVLRFGYGK